MKSWLTRIRNWGLVQKHWTLLKFVLVGGTNTLLDFVIYGILANAVSLPAIAANTISTSICMVVSFFLNYQFVWESKKSRLETAPRFLLMSLFSAWIVQNGIIWIVTLIAGDGAMINLGAKILGIVGGTASNYFGYKWTFKS